MVKTEPREDKIKRLIEEDRIAITRDSPKLVIFKVFGYHGIHEVIWQRREQELISCSCLGEIYIGKKYQKCCHAEACIRYYELQKIKQIGDKNTAYPDL